MEIIPLNSKIRQIPTNIHPRQIIYFNALRYSVDMCEISFNRLIENLSIISDAKILTPKDFPSIFLDAWSIINTCTIFKKIVRSEIEIDENHENFTWINKAICLRNSNQHINERLEKIHDLELPVFGSLTWTKKDVNTNDILITSAYSGTFSHKADSAVNFSNRTLDELNPVIQKIELTSITREGKKQYTYREESVYINEIIREIKSWIKVIDFQMDNQLKNEIKTHDSDLLIQFYAQQIDIK